MSSPPSYGFLNNPSLPSRENIREFCLGLGFVRGTPIHDSSSTLPIAWVKYGPYVTIDEARTQDWTAKALCDAGVSDLRVPRVYDMFPVDYYGYPLGFIVMEFISGVDCDGHDVELVAKAVERLINLKAPPDATLGHVGGGPASLVHSFFPEWLPNANYRSDQDFYAHIHNIVKRLGISPSVDVSNHSLYLCLSDFNAGNFRKHDTEDGRSILVAFDFRATCFMPVPFIELALRKPLDNFCRAVAEKIQYPHPPSKDVKFLHAASYALIPYGLKAVALPEGVNHTR